MKKKLLLYLGVMLLALFTKQLSAQNPVTIASFEPEDNIEFAYLASWTAGDVDTVPNPVSDAINASATCAQLTKTSQWSSVMEFNSFEFPLSIYSNPKLTLKLMSSTSTDLNINITLKDIYGATVIINDQSTPSATNEWKDYTFDFSKFLSTTAISLIQSVQIFIDYGNTNTGDIFFIDDVIMTGENVNITEDDRVTLFQETTNNNYWSELIDEIGKIDSWGPVMVGGMEHYNVKDTVVCEFIWTPEANCHAIKLYPKTQGLERDQLIIKQNIVGKANLELSYFFRWYTGSMHDGTSLPSVEYKVDNGDWASVATSVTLASSQVWDSVGYDLSGAPAGDTIYLRISNAHATEFVAIDDISITGTNKFASSISITGEESISVFHGEAQLSSVTLPENASQAAFFYISEGRYLASIDNLTGKVTAKDDGEITVTAIAIDKKGTTQTTHTIVIDNQNPLESVKITSVDDVAIIDKAFAALQLSTEVAPTNASNPSVVWSSSDNAVATVDANGLVTAVYNGSVNIMATSNEDEAIADTITITVSNQYILVSDIKLSINGAATIPTYMDTVRVFAKILPANADTTSVTWTTSSEAIATIDEHGLVSIKDTGVVYIIAKAQDISNVSDTFKLSFKDRVALVTSVEIVAEGGISEITKDNGSLQLKTAIAPHYATDQSITWSVSNEDYASIDENGLLSALRNGTVSVIAVANGGENVSDTLEVKISGQIILASDIEITTVDGITTIDIDKGTLQLSAELTPTYTTETSVNWSVISFTQASSTIDENGLLTAVSNGEVSVIATTLESGIADTIQVMISNQVQPLTITAEKAIDVQYITGADDYSLSANLTWKNDSIFISIDVTDDVIVTKATTGGNDWDIDNIEIYLDMDNSKSPIYPRLTGWPESTYDANDYQLRISPDSSIVPASYIQYAYTQTEKGYAFELAIPFDSLMPGFDASIGTLLGFDILASDNDNDPNFRDQISWNTVSGMVWNDPSYFGTLKLADNNSFEVVLDTEAPTTATELSISTLGDAAILVWTPSTDNIAVQTYIIYQDSVAIDTILADTLPTYTVGGLAAGTYVFGVVASDIYDNLSTMATSTIDFIPTVLVASIEVRGEDDVTTIDVAGGTLQMMATITPEDAATQDVTWSVNNQEIASIDATTGILTALANGEVEVTATAIDGSEVTGSATITVSGQVSVNDNAFDNIKVYPIPVNDELHIENIAEIVRIDILNINGQLIKTIENNAVNTTINVSELSNGIYHLRMQYNNGMLIRKFIK